MTSPAPEGNRILVVLSWLCAEGTPVLTLDLCRRWKAWGLEPVVATLASRPRDLEPEFAAAGIEVVHLDVPPAGAWRFPMLTAAVEELCRSLRPRGVLSMPLGWHAFILGAARLAGVRFTAAHVGNLAPHEGGAAFEKFRLLVQAGRPFTDSLICCSRYVQDSVRDHFLVPVAETEVIYNGVPIDEVAARSNARRIDLAATAITAAASASRPKAPHRMVVGMVARLEIHKDQPTLIRAAALCRERGVELEVWLVGEGSRRNEYQLLIESLGLAGTVRLLGMRRDIPELLAGMDVFVFAAKPDEGLGVALIEAMAARVPIVATDVGACREVLQADSVHPLGQLIPPADPEALARALQRLATGPRDESLLDRANERARVVFSLESMAESYARVLGFPAFPNALPTRAPAWNGDRKGDGVGNGDAQRRAQQAAR